MFQVGEHVIYGNSGVCKVESISQMDMGGGPKDYYTLIPIYGRNSRVITSVDNEKVKIRPVISREESKELLDQIDSLETLIVADEKKREDIYKEAVRSCDAREWLKMVKTLRLRRQDRMARGKRATSADEKYLHIVENNLFGEFAFSLQISREEVETFLHSHC